MEKRYQVFVSSTYSDLKEERQAVMQALMEMDCIPAGMELFPAADEEQLEFITKVIDDCDYYLLILGGRYGSVSEDGISYTEKEFDYAVSKGIKVVALVHGATDELPFAKVEASEDARAKLKSFREKVCTGRLVKFWSASAELPGLVALSLQKTIKMHPATGWVRGGQPASADVLAQINALRIENDRLKAELLEERQRTVEIPPDLASGSDSHEFVVKIQYYHNGFPRYTPTSIKETWDSIFSKIGPNVISPTGEASVKAGFEAALKETKDFSGSVTVSDDTMATIAVQLSALGLVTVYSAKTTQGSYGVFWHITKAGLTHLTAIRLVRKRPQE